MPNAASPADAGLTISDIIPVRVQEAVRQHVRVYHLAVGAAIGLITVVFLALIGVLLLIATNFNLLGAIE